MLHCYSADNSLRDSTNSLKCFDQQGETTTLYIDAPSQYRLGFQFYKLVYCILRGRIKGFNSSITTIMCQVGSYRTVVG